MNISQAPAVKICASVHALYKGHVQLVFGSQGANFASRNKETTTSTRFAPDKSDDMVSCVPSGVHVLPCGKEPNELVVPG